jgi:hypothetical protein
MLCLALGLGAILAGGCNYLGYFGYLVAPEEPAKTIQAEFKDLPGKTLAVVVFAEPKLLYDYPFVRDEISGAVGDQLTRNVEHLKAVSPRQIVRYQQENPEWDSEGRTALGKALQCDYVLHISVVEFSTLEQGSEYLHRGRITAQATLYKTSLPEASACAWRGNEVRLAYPENEPVGQVVEDDRALRIETIRRFADLLAKKFYKHEIKEAAK